MKSLPGRILPLIALTTGLCSVSLPATTFGNEVKRVLVVTVTTGFRHSSIETAERILQKLAHESKDFLIVEVLRQPDVVVPKKPTPPRPLAPDADENAKKRFDNDTAHYQDSLSRWTPEQDVAAKKAQEEFTRQATQTLAKLSPAALEESKIDAVIFANTTGDLPLPDKEGFVKWIEQGHALIGTHSASDTLHSFPGYTSLLGGEFAGHGSQSTVDLLSIDPSHPASGKIPSPWHINREEMYHLKNYTRTKVHDLWASPKVPMDGKPDQGQSNHFPVSWIRTQGKGRVFYTSLGHREDIWDDNKDLPNRLNPPETARAFQQHLLGGLRWAVGIVDGSAEPQEKAAPPKEEAAPVQ